MGKTSRDKGKRGQLYCRDLMRRVWPKAKSTSDQFNGAEYCDVENTPFWIEAKHGARINLWAALRQAEADSTAAGDLRPILLYLRLDRRPAVVVMLANDWIDREAAAVLGRMFG